MKQVPTRGGALVECFPVENEQGAAIRTNIPRCKITVRRAAGKGAAIAPPGSSRLDQMRVIVKAGVPHFLELGIVGERKLAVPGMQSLQLREKADVAAIRNDRSRF